GRAPSPPIHLLPVVAGASASAAPYAIRIPATTSAAALPRDIEAPRAVRRPHVRPGRRSVPRLREQEHHVADPPLGETGLAVAQVQRPEALEATVVAERLETIQVAPEVLPPAPQRLGVVRR